MENDNQDRTAPGNRSAWKFMIYVLVLPLLLLFLAEWLLR